MKYYAKLKTVTKQIFKKTFFICFKWLHIKLLNRYQVYKNKYQFFALGDKQKIF